MGAVVSSVMPFVTKAATSFVVSSMQNKVFGSANPMFSANSGAFSAEMATAGAQEASAILVNKQSNNASIPLILGRRRIGGTRVFIDTTDGAGDNTATSHLNIALVIAEGGGGAGGWPTKMYFDEKLVWDASASGSINYFGGTAQNTSFGRLENFIGGSTNLIGGNTAETGGTDCIVWWNCGSSNASPTNFPADWQTSVGASTWTNSHELNGLQVAYIILEANADYYEGTVPTITFETDGVRMSPINQALIDSPTHNQYIQNFELTGSTGANPVDALYFYLADPLFGKGLDFDYFNGVFTPGADIDLASFKLARDYCEQTVTRNGTSQKRYEINGVLQTSAKLYENVDMLINSFNGILIYSNGKYFLKIKQPNEQSVFNFNKDNLLGDIEMNFVGANTKINRVAVSYSNPDNNYNDDMVYVFDSNKLAQDDYKVLEAKVDMPMITNTDLINSLAQYKMDSSREVISINFTAPHTAIKVECGDVISMTHDVFGFTNKKFRVLVMEIMSDNTIQIVATEYNSGIEI